MNKTNTSNSKFQHLKSYDVIKFTDPTQKKPQKQTTLNDNFKYDSVASSSLELKHPN